MRQAGWIVALICLAACNANPLLHEASANYAPLAVGERWTYQTSAGQTLSRVVAASLSQVSLATLRDLVSTR